MAVYLTPKEKEVLLLDAEGLSDSQIASKLFVSLSTIGYHHDNIYKKLKVDNRIKAFRRALKLGLIEIDIDVWTGKKEEDPPKTKIYPTIKEVDKAPAQQLSNWYRHLPPPGLTNVKDKAREENIIEQIKDRLAKWAVAKFN